MEEERVNDQLEQAFGEAEAEMETIQPEAAEAAPEPEAAEAAAEPAEVPEETAAPEEAEQPAEPSQTPEIDPAIYAGWQELARAHPEVVGKPLPDDIMKACVESGLPPLRVYESMRLVKQGEQIEALKQEIAALRQNAEAAARAPVTAASTGGSDGNEAEDPFERGFNHLMPRSQG